MLACASSAGIHAALTPEHVREGAGAGIGFAAATVLVAVPAVALRRAPGEPAFAAAAAVFAGLLASYALAVTTGLPVVHPEREAIDGLALVTKAVEAAGLLLATGWVLRPARIHLPETKGSAT